MIHNFFFKKKSLASSYEIVPFMTKSRRVRSIEWKSELNLTGANKSIEKYFGCFDKKLYIAFCLKVSRTEIPCGNATLLCANLSSIKRIKVHHKIMIMYFIDARTFLSSYSVFKWILFSYCLFVVCFIYVKLLIFIDRELTGKDSICHSFIFDCGPL